MSESVLFRLAGKFVKRQKTCEMHLSQDFFVPHVLFLLWPRLFCHDHTHFAATAPIFQWPRPFCCNRTYFAVTTPILLQPCLFCLDHTYFVATTPNFQWPRPIFHIRVYFSVTTPLFCHNPPILTWPRNFFWCTTNFLRSSANQFANGGMGTFAENPHLAKKIHSSLYI